jgi:glycosyltransferase involved in cell wall biosynthesis
MRDRLILSANATPHQGGQGLNLYHMIEGSRAEFDLSVFCQSACPGVETQVVPDSRVSKLIGRVRILRRLRDWKTWFTDTHFDRYVADRISPTTIFQGVTGQCGESLKRAREKGCRTFLDVITMHIDDFGAHQDRECLKFQIRPSINRYHRERIRLEYERADLIRVMSDGARRTFLERGISPERIAVVRPPMDLADFPEAQFPGPKFRVIFVGLFEPWKGFHYLIEAFNALNLPESELILWGAPGARSINQYLQRHMARNRAISWKAVDVRRYGYAEVYGKASVLVHPSLSDGFGFVVAEAMASGIPVIVTRNTGAADLIVDGHNGYLVPAGDSDAIRDRLAQLAGHPALMREMGRAARATIGSLTFDQFRSQYHTCLRALAA